MFLLRWFWRCWFNDGFVFFQGVYWLEADLTLDFAMPKLGLCFPNGSIPFWACSFELQNLSPGSLFEPRLLESIVQVGERNVWSLCRSSKLACSPYHKNVKMLVLLFFYCFLFQSQLFVLVFMIPDLLTGCSSYIRNSFWIQYEKNTIAQLTRGLCMNEFESILFSYLLKFQGGKVALYCLTQPW